MSGILCHYCRFPDSSDVGCIGGQPTSNNDTGARVTVDRSVELPGICWFATNFYWTDQFLPTNFASANFNWPNLYVVLQITIDLHGAWLSLIFQIFSTEHRNIIISEYTHSTSYLLHWERSSTKNDFTLLNIGCSFHKNRCFYLERFINCQHFV